MKAYMASFDAGFLALLPTPQALPELAKSVQGVLQKSGGQHAHQLHHGLIRQAAMSMTHAAACVCTTATAAVPPHWRQTLKILLAEKS